MKKPLPIGHEFYKRIIEKELYYVDKTLLIKDILDKNTQVNLFTRPRRYGKTLTLTMLKTFFEQEIDVNGNIIDNSVYFDGMNIMQAGEKYTSKMGKYPVIFLSLKSGKQPNFEMAYQCMVDEIVKEYERHRYVLLGDKLLDSNKEKYHTIMERKAEPAVYAKGLEFLSSCLSEYHNKNVIILIDEYDVPLENSYFTGFYDEMIGFIRSLFESALKTNSYLELAVITGCLRVSRESIFTGLNNLEVISVLNNEYSEYFGFTQTEVEDMLKYYDLEHKLEEAKEWYNGYIFGETQVYNPWSMINYVKTLCSDAKAFPKPYWSNTSSNSIVRELIEAADDNTKQEIEGLIAGETIEKPVHEEITYGDIHVSMDNLWNFLFLTGYLKVTDKRFEADTTYLTMKIPNREIKYIYRNTILEWFGQKLKNTDLSGLANAFKEKDCAKLEEIITNQLLETISFYDYAESYYHGFLTGLLKACSGFVTLSNRESGNGRPDIIMKTPSVRGVAIIMELKIVKDFDDMENGCLQALNQIEEQNYEAALYKEGYRNILKYGICFYRKECMVKRLNT